MPKINKQFEPAEQFEQLFVEIGEQMRQLNAAFERLEWLRSKAIAEFRAVRDAADKLEVFTEAEAAAVLKVTERALADLRRQHELPHSLFGIQPRYTRQHLKEICRILESRPRGTAIRSAA
jgi:hypothetical protein